MHCCPAGPRRRPSLRHVRGGGGAVIVPNLPTGDHSPDLRETATASSTRNHRVERRRAGSRPRRASRGRRVNGKHDGWGGNYPHCVRLRAGARWAVLVNPGSMQRRWASVRVSWRGMLARQGAASQCRPAPHGDTGRGPGPAWLPVLCTQERFYFRLRGAAIAVAVSTEESSDPVGEHVLGRLLGRRGGLFGRQDRLDKLAHI
jgi:hypothetical protein